MNAILAVLLLAQPPQPTQADTIKLKSGEVKGKVQKMTASSVTYTDPAGKTVTAKAEDVVDVKLGDAPGLLTRANNAASTRNWEKAFLLYDEALKEVSDKKVRELHKQYIIWNWGLSILEKGDPEGALRKLKSLRTDCGDCRLRPESFRKSIDIARKVGDAALVEVLDEMKAEPEPTGSEAKFELVRMKYAKGEFAEAQGGFTELSSSANAAIAAEAKLYSLRCLRGLKKFDELEQTCARYAGDRGSPALYQAANAGLGDSILKKMAQDKTKLRDALLAFANAIAVGPPASKDQAEDYAVALLGAGRCCAMMADAVERQEAKDEYRRRATGYWTEVVRTYRGTDWATSAQKELSGLPK